MPSAANRIALPSVEALDRWRCLRRARQRERGRQGPWRQHEESAAHEMHLSSPEEVTTRHPSYDLPQRGSRLVKRVFRPGALVNVTFGALAEESSQSLRSAFSSSPGSHSHSFARPDCAGVRGGAVREADRGWVFGAGCVRRQEPFRRLGRRPGAEWVKAMSTARVSATRDRFSTDRRSDLRLPESRRPIHRLPSTAGTSSSSGRTTDCGRIQITRRTMSSALASLAQASCSTETAFRSRPPRGSNSTRASRSTARAFSWSGRTSSQALGTSTGARMSPAGKVLDRDGFVIASGDKEQLDPAVAFDGTRYLVAWSQEARRGV